MKDQVFLVGQKAFIRNERGELLILLDGNIGIDLPGGKIQQGETDLYESLRREVKEETSLEIEVNDVFQTWLVHFPMFANQAITNKQLYLVGYHCKLVDGSVILSDEHVDYKWISQSDFNYMKEKSGHYQAVKFYFDHLDD